LYLFAPCVPFLQLLQHHIVPTAALPSSRLLPGQQLNTALTGAAPLVVRLDDDDIEISAPSASRVDDDAESAEVKVADIQAGKTVIHVIDEVLVPASLHLAAVPASLQYSAGDAGDSRRLRQQHTASVTVSVQPRIRSSAAAAEVHVGA
jgi:hypothetical protein